MSKSGPLPYNLVLQTATHNHRAESGSKKNNSCAVGRCSGRRQRHATCSAAVWLQFLASCIEEEGAGRNHGAGFAVLCWEPFPFPHVAGKNDLKVIVRKSGAGEWGWPHLPHLSSNFGEDLGSNTKPFSFSLSLFPLSQAIT